MGRLIREGRPWNTSHQEKLTDESFGDLICPLSQTRTPVKKTSCPHPKSDYEGQKVSDPGEKQNKTIIVHEIVCRDPGALWGAGSQIGITGCAN